MLERRAFLKAMAGMAAFAAVAGVASATAAPILVQRPDDDLSPAAEPQPAVATGKDVDDAGLQQVRWGRGRGRGWARGRRGFGRRRWGWGRRRWRRRMIWRPRRRRRWRRVRYYW